MNKDGLDEEGTQLEGVIKGEVQETAGMRWRNIEDVVKGA